MRQRDRRTAALPWWTRLLGVLMILALTLPRDATACPRVDVHACCCCTGAAEADDAPAVKRAPCCASHEVVAPVAPVALLEAPPTAPDATAASSMSLASLASPLSRARPASARARGPPRRVPIYQRTCAYLL